jgi:hypothetical protein
MLDASGIRTGDNPPYTLNDFYISYPQFNEDTNGNYVAPVEVQEMYLEFANACIKEARWHKSWKLAMGWFMAHFLTLYVQGMADPNSKEAGIINAGKALGLQTSKSVGDLSISIDYNSLASGVNGWATWKSTKYGQQLMQVGRLVGMGMMYVN